MTLFQKGMRSAAMGLLLAGSAIAVSGAAYAQGAFTSLDRTAKGKVSFSGAERGKPIEAGQQINVTGDGYRPGQKITLLYGSNPLPGGNLVADGEGKVAGKITVPANAVSGIHPILVVAEGPYTASVAELKVSPTVPLSGLADYTLLEVLPAKGLYQSVYSAKSNALFLTSAIGRPPISDTAVLKLDPVTLKVVARATPPEAPPPAARPAGAPPAGGPGGPGGPGAAPAAPQGPGYYAVFGIGIDDTNGNVWTTNTRHNTIAVYRQSDLKLVKQFDAGTVEHARDVVVDQVLNKAFVGATATTDVVAFDSTTLTKGKTIRIASLKRGEDFSVGSLSLDPKAHKLYVVSLSTAEVAIINTQTDTVEKVLPVPGVRSAIGVSHDPVTGRIFVAAQGSDNVVVLDGNTGAVIADTPTGAGALNVIFDSVKRRGYVSNRGAGTITVIDVDGKIVANLGPAPLANHVSLGKDGVVYAVDKSANAKNADGDAVLRIQPKR